MIDDIGGTEGQFAGIVAVVFRQVQTALELLRDNLGIL